MQLLIGNRLILASILITTLRQVSIIGLLLCAIELFGWVRSGTSIIDHAFGIKTIRQTIRRGSIYYRLVILYLRRLVLDAYIAYLTLMLFALALERRCAAWQTGRRRCLSDWIDIS